MMITNLFVIANVKQLRTDGSFRIVLPFSRTSWNVGFLNSAILNSFHNRAEFGTIFEGLRNFRGKGGVYPPSSSSSSSSVRHWWSDLVHWEWLLARRYLAKCSCCCASLY